MRKHFRNAVLIGAAILELCPVAFAQTYGTRGYSPGAWKPEELPKVLVSYVQNRGKYDYLHHCEVGSDNADFVSDEIVDRFCLVGPIEQHRKKLEALRKAGVTQFNIYLMCGDEEKTLETYGREVLPRYGSAVSKSTA